MLVCSFYWRMGSWFIFWTANSSHLKLATLHPPTTYLFAFHPPCLPTLGTPNPALGLVTILNFKCWSPLFPVTIKIMINFFYMSYDFYHSLIKINYKFFSIKIFVFVILTKSPYAVLETGFNQSCFTWNNMSVLICQSTMKNKCLGPFFNLKVLSGN